MPNNLWEAFENTVKYAAKHPAFIMDGRSYSFGQWYDRTIELCQIYSNLGVSKGDRVLIWMENKVDIAVALTAAWGCDAIPALIDSNCRQSQLETAIETVAPAAICFEDSFLQPFDSTVPMLQLKGIAWKETTKFIPHPKAIPTDPASIVFTSGSTGKPKGVVQSHGNLFRGCHSVFYYLGLKQTDRLLSAVPWSFDYGYGQLLTTVICGITQIIPKIQNPVGLCEAIEEHEATVLPGTPSVFTYLTSGMSPITKTDLSSLRILTNTGGSIHRNLLNLLLSIFENSELVLNYGLTETYRSTYLSPSLVRKYPGSIGRAIPGVDVVVVREDDSVAEPFEKGEIVHRGDYICIGYWGDETATMSAKKRDPLVSDALFQNHSLYTGDIGYKDEEGLLYFDGRRDHQLKSMGVRISPGEIEEILYQSRMIEQVAVFGIEHELMGHEILAALVLKKGIDYQQRALDKYVRRNISQYMIPRRYIIMDALPKTTTGKIDYNTLKQSV